ncbi:hypothetical protein SmJEL517_g01776 [Synchytrium microbalum]|uniref:NodB homology domain-containing protein n=1 Tax=Synchytrium microbalum TaxID=1806994 RepID=A0A507CET1_9FUNG|nr:uncharacterized protein SmJEL517_g01776 [Synchytrium microbalum]TPX36023.1 hypothetical protein SmJEL517_g01776 [Synchytrium microbalum]
MAKRTATLLAATALFSGTWAQYNASSFPKPGSMYSVAQCAANAGICLPGQWPTPDRVPAVVPEWVASINLTGLASATIRPASMQFSVACDPTLIDYYGANGVCDFTCVGCTRAGNPSVGGEYTTCPTKGDWATTYDDGSSNNTVPVLDHLKSLGVHATFFVIGSRVLQRPDILLRTYNEGHQICLHTWAHAAPTAMTNEQIVTDTYWTAKAVYQVLGIVPTCTRTPYGDQDDRTRSVYKAMGLRMMGWNRDTSDWKSNNPALNFTPSWIIGNVSQWVAAAPNLTTGIISLEHDLYTVTAAYALPAQDLITQAGFKIKTVADCLSYTNMYQSITNPTGTNMNLTSLSMYSDGGVLKVGTSATSGVNPGAVLGLATLLICIGINLLFFI